MEATFFFFSISDTLAEDVSRIGQKDLAIKCSFCRIKQAIWRVFRARHKDSIAAPYFHAIKIQKFSLGDIEKSSRQLWRTSVGTISKKLLKQPYLQRKNLR